MRFAAGGVASNSLPNPAELIAQLEEEKRRKEERAAKFGTKIPELEQIKIAERQKRFQAAKSEEQDLIAQRKARFGQ